ncbi:oligosaccharide flippase family protein [bacterium]|nr:oligosaccharide flippase family protein [bacterium]MBU1985319.1 oligosaccharide flippase family protein [bacterium]
MLEQLKRLTRDSVVYGVGHIATRLLTFLLLPYYSFRLTPAEYGELTLYFMFMAVAQTFFIYGLDIAYLRYFTLSKESEQRRRITGTALCVSLLTSVLLTGMVLGFAETIGRLVVQVPTQPENVSFLIRLCAGILLFDTLATFPFLLLRGTLRPYHFAGVKLLNVCVNIGLNIWFVGYLHLSILGVLYANVIASAMTLGVLLPFFRGRVTWKIDRRILGEMVKFGLPNVPTYLFVMVIELADRKILELYRGLEEAGLYSAGYKLGMFMAVVTGAFRFAWQPFFLSNADREDAPRLFARVLTYYLLVTGVLLLVLAFFVDLIVKTPWPGIGCILAPSYWPGLAVFPIILLAHIFDGIYANLMVGVYLKKLTARLPLVTGIAAAVTIGLNLLLIPRYGMMAAAWVTLLAFILEAFGLWLVVRRAYVVPYEWTRIAKMVLVFAVLYALSQLPPFETPLMRLLLVISLPIALYAVAFFDEREKHHLRKMFARG